MEYNNNLERRRAERRRRERRRKKRIRAALLLICLIVVIVLIIMAAVSCSHKKSDSETDSTTDETLVISSSPEASSEETSPEESAEPALSSTQSPSIPSADVENNLLEVIEAADAAGGVKTCYLTFDDGPSETVTPSVLDTLRKYNIKATFFEVGTSISAYPDMSRRVYEEGHLIANHSMSHNYDKLYADEEVFMDEVNTCESSIDEITHDTNKMKLFRFPGGSYNAGDHAAEKQIYKQTLADNGIYYIDWNSLNGDAEGAKKDAAGLLDYVKQYTDTSSSAVVLMHDAEAKKTTAEALESIIQYFISEGYQFKRLDQIEFPTETPVPSDTVSDVSTEETY